MKNFRTNLKTVFVKLFLFLCLFLGLSNKTQSQGTLTFTFQLDKLDHNAPQCAIWIEDADGNYIETVFITNFVGERGGGHPSGNNRISALPIWAHKRDVIDNSGSTDSYYPPKSTASTYPADIDAVSGATSVSLSTYNYTLNNYSPGTYKCYIEVNQSWDYTNDYTSATNANGQPSALWSVDINVSENTDEVQILDYIGYGSHTGDDGTINAPDNTITSAYNLLKTHGSGNSAYKFKVNFTPENTTGISSQSIQKAGFKIYPNPASSGEVTLKLYGIKEDAMLKITDQKGAVVKEQKLLCQKDKFTLKTSGLSKGRYIVSLRLPNNLSYGQLLVIE